jgi:transcriptional regulator with XRE-family HTH domain
MSQKAQKIRTLKGYMMIKGITSRQIAKRAGVSETWVSLVIHGRGKSERIRKMIAEALDMKVEDLWDNNNQRAA